MAGLILIAQPTDGVGNITRYSGKVAAARALEAFEHPCITRAAVPVPEPDSPDLEHRLPALIAAVRRRSS